MGGVMTSSCATRQEVFWVLQISRDPTTAARQLEYAKPHFENALCPNTPGVSCCKHSCRVSCCRLVTDHLGCSSSQVDFSRDSVHQQHLPMVVIVHQRMQPPVALLVHLFLAWLPAQSIPVREDATCGQDQQCSMDSSSCQHAMQRAQLQVVQKLACGSVRLLAVWHHPLQPRFVAGYTAKPCKGQCLQQMQSRTGSVSPGGMFMCWYMWALPARANPTPYVSLSPYMNSYRWPLLKALRNQVHSSMSARHPTSPVSSIRCSTRSPETCIVAQTPAFLVSGSFSLLIVIVQNWNSYSVCNLSRCRRKATCYKLSGIKVLHGGAVQKEHGPVAAPPWWPAHRGA